MPDTKAHPLFQFLGASFDELTEEKAQAIRTGSPALTRVLVVLLGAVEDLTIALRTAEQIRTAITDEMGSEAAKADKGVAPDAAWVIKHAGRYQTVAQQIRTLEHTVRTYGMLRKDLKADAARATHAAMLAKIETP